MIYLCYNDNKFEYKILNFIKSKTDELYTYLHFIL